MKTIYEWGIELLDVDGDIQDGDYFEHLSSIPGDAKNLKELHELSLVKTIWNTDTETMESRTWAYVEDGALPKEFENGDKVPARFHNEYNRYNHG